jgi:hypothetical protein
MLISVSLCTGSELSAADDEVMGIQGHVLLVAEDDLALDDDGVEHWGFLDVDKEAHAFRNVH